MSPFCTSVRSRELELRKKQREEEDAKRMSMMNQTFSRILGTSQSRDMVVLLLFFSKLRIDTLISDGAQSHAEPLPHAREAAGRLLRPLRQVRFTSNTS